MAVVNTVSTSNNNRQALITCYFSLYQISFVRWLIFSDAELQSLHVIMNECEVFQTCIHTHILSPSFYSYFPCFLSVFPPHTQARTHTHTRKTERKRQRERERKQHWDRARRRTGKGNSCAVLPLHSFLLGWSFPSGGERDCKLSKRTVRKQEAASSSRESEMKSICGACSPGRPAGHC